MQHQEKDQLLFNSTTALVARQNSKQRVAKPDLRLITVIHGYIKIKPLEDYVTER